MIYLVGGAPRCGKTILSKELAKKTGASWISTDSIEVAIKAITPKSQLDKKFPYEKLQRQNEGTPYVDMAKNSAAALLRAEITEAKSIWPSVREIIKHFIDTKQDSIVEGVHLMPSLVAELRQTKYWKQLKLVYLVKTDLALIKDGFHRNTSPYDWMADALKDEALLDKMANMVKTKSAYIESQAKKFHFKVFNMDKNFEATVKTLAEA